MAAAPTSPRLTSELAPAAQGTPPATAEATVHAVATVQLEGTVHVTAAPLVGESAPAYNAEAKALAPPTSVEPTAIPAPAAAEVKNLPSVSPEKYDIKKELAAAQSSLNSDDKDAAEAKYKNIIEHLPAAHRTCRDVLIFIACKIGVAICKPTDHFRRGHIEDAIKALKEILENTALWNSVSKEESEATYQELNSLYEKLKAFSSIDGITQKLSDLEPLIKQCRAFLDSKPEDEAPKAASAAPAVASTVVYDAQARFMRAKDYLGRSDKENARRVFNEIIQNLRGETALESLLMTVNCQMETARTHLNGSSEKPYWISQAKETCDQIYENRASWRDKEKLTNYEKLIKNYEDLSALLRRNDPARDDIDAKLQACRKEFAPLKISAQPVPSFPDAAPEAAGQTPPPSPAVERPFSPASSPTAPEPGAAVAKPAAASTAGAALPPPSFAPPPPPPEESDRSAPITATAPPIASAPAASSSASAYNPEKRYFEAKSLLMANQLDNARLIFEEIIPYLQSNQLGNSLLMACAQIGIAYTYPPGNERSAKASETKTLFEKLFAERKSVNPAHKKAYYPELFWGLNGLLRALSREDTSRRTIAEYVQTCAEEERSLGSISPADTRTSPLPAAVAPLPPPPLAPPPEPTRSAAPEPAEATSSPKGKKVTIKVPFNATDYTDARSSLAIGNYEEAQAQFEKILNQLEEAKSIDDLLILAGSQLGYANSIQGANPNEKHLPQKYIDKAVQTCKTIYQRLESASALVPSHKKIAHYEALTEHYSILVNMVSDGKRQEIRERLTLCTVQITSLKASLASASSKDTAPSSGAAPAAAPSPSASGAERAPSPPPQPPAPQPKSPPVVPPLPTDGLNPTPRGAGGAPAGEQPASSSISPRKPAAPGPAPVSPRRVTPGPVGSSSTIRVIFGLSIAAILAAIAGVVIYNNRRWFVKK